MALLVFHVLPSLVSGVFFIIIISLLAIIFRIKNPSIKAFLYILILYKALEAMFIISTSISSHFGFSFRIIDPMNIIPHSLDTFTPFFIGGPVYNQIIFVLVGICAAIIIFRWLMLWKFYSSLSNDKLIIPGDCPSLDKIINKYCKILNINRPKVALSLKNHFLPAVIGMFRPVLILSPKMVDEMNPEQLEVIIAHELSHIKRKDNYFHWLALIFRDLTFFNPVSHFAFNKYLKYKEIATNNLVKKLTEISHDEIIFCAEEVKKFVRDNKIKELPSLSSAIKYKDKFSSKKIFNLTKVKIILFSSLFIFLAMLQCITMLPLGNL